MLNNQLTLLDIEDYKSIRQCDKIYDDDLVIEHAFDYYRKTGFPYRDLPLHMCMQEINKLASLPNDVLFTTLAGYQIADTYHKHRFHATAQGMKSPVDSFKSDKNLRKALKLRLHYAGYIPDNLFGELTLVNGTQACSNFRPGFALLLYRRYGKPGCVVLDTSTGYGGRLIGYIASGFKGLYIGIDPNTETHNANIRMATDLNYLSYVELHNQPVEDVDINKVRGRCDFAFTSPPYFIKEKYSHEDTQSWVRYKTEKDWRKGFLRPMMHLQYEALKGGCYSVVNISKIKIDSKVHNVDDWCIEEGIAVGFNYLGRETYGLSHRLGSEDDTVATEPVLIFRKDK